MKTALTLITALALALAMTACAKPETNEQPNEETDGLGFERGTELSEPKLGDIFEDVTNPITGARAYEEMQETPYGLRSRVIVEYKGKKTEMEPSSAIIEFSPDGKYLLYVQGLAPENASGTSLYNTETGNTQELIPSVPDTNPRYKPSPAESYVQWGDGELTYTKFGKTFTLTFKEE